MPMGEADQLQTLQDASCRVASEVASSEGGAGGAEVGGAVSEEVEAIAAAPAGEE